jgi:hypothetical protein
LPIIAVAPAQLLFNQLKAFINKKALVIHQISGYYILHKLEPVLNRRFVPNHSTLTHQINLIKNK